MKIDTIYDQLVTFSMRVFAQKFYQSKINDTRPQSIQHWWIAIIWLQLLPKWILRIKNDQLFAGGLLHVHWNTLQGFCYAYLLSVRIGGKQCAWVLIYSYAFKYFCNVYLTFEHSHWDQIFVMYCNNLVVKWYIEHALECGYF